MTVEEAIETLKRNYPSERFEQLREAVDMAISALKAEAERENEPVGCNGCRYDWFGDPRCARCTRSFLDYYKADMKGE